MDETKIAHLHTIDQSGGGAKIVRNLNENINNSSQLNSHLFVGKKKTDLADVTQLPSASNEEKLNQFVEHILSMEGLAAPSSFRYPKILRDYDPDIIHLHNIHGNYFNFLNISRLPSDVPIVWTFHDMWPLTGRCVYSFDCDRYTKTCHHCPYLDTSKQIMFDSTTLLHTLKKKLFSACSPVIIAPSKWMENNIRHSSLDTTEVDYIPHGVDTDFFSPIAIKRARDTFDIDTGSILVLFISNGLSDPRKGMEHLIAALNNISTDSISLLAVGGKELPTNQIPDHMTVYNPGYIDNDRLPFAYSAADVTVVPSLYESFGLVATESMACGTPVVAYRTSGLKEQITESTGWLAEFRNVDSLAEKIEKAIQNKDTCRSKGKQARERVIQNYDQRRFINDHKTKYREIVKNSE